MQNFLMYSIVDCRALLLQYYSHPTPTTKPSVIRSTIMEEEDLWQIEHEYKSALSTSHPPLRDVVLACCGNL